MRWMLVVWMLGLVACAESTTEEAPDEGCVVTVVACICDSEGCIDHDCNACTCPGGESYCELPLYYACETEAPRDLHGGDISWCAVSGHIDQR